MGIHDRHDGAACDGCALVGRRDFLRDLGIIAAGALVALGASPARAAAAPLEFVTGMDVPGADEEKSYPVPAKDGAQIDKDNSTIVARWQGKVYVFSLACPHQNTALHWSDTDAQFECPKHHSRFLPDGEYVKDSGRATRAMDRFAVRLQGTNVVADLDKLYQEDQDDAWKTAFVAITG